MGDAVPWSYEEMERQIEWETYFISKCDIFSMYFAGGDSVQPICLFELGKYGFGKIYYYRRFVITVDSEYKRKDDVTIQTNIAMKNDAELQNHVDIEVCSSEYNPSWYRHFERISVAINRNVSCGDWVQF